MYSLYNKFVCDLEFEVGYVFEMDDRVIEMDIIIFCKWR